MSFTPVANKCPPHLTQEQFAVLQPQDDDTPRTQTAKSFIKKKNYVITPEKANSISFVDLNSKQASEATKALFAKVKRRREAIYRWKVENKRYVGKAADAKKRFASYKSTFNRKNQKTVTPLASAVHQAAENKTPVQFGILYNNVPPEALGRVEDLLIRVHEATNPKKGFNKRAGGGGSSERKILTEVDITKIREVCEKVLSEKDLKKTHQKAGKFTKDENGRVVLDTTDLQKKEVYKNAEGVVYSIEDKKKSMRYVGMTTRKLSKRLSEHLTYVNDKDKKREKKLYDKMLKRPENFRLRVLYTAPKEQRHILEEIEKAYILRYNAHQEETGYNDNTGSIRLSIKSACATSSQRMTDGIKKIQNIFKKLQKKASSEK